MLHVNYLNKSGMKKPTYIKWKKKKKGGGSRVKGSHSPLGTNL